jgi:hypothetical protein
MKSSNRAASLLFLIAAAGFTVHAQEDQSGAAGCDRSCLINWVDAYLTALVAHDPERVPIAENARFVENATALVPGAGLWMSAVEVPTNFRIYVPDPVAQQVGFMGLMKALVTVETGQETRPVLLALRLKLENGRISEMEHLLARNLGERNLPNLLLPRKGLLVTVPEAERMPRNELLRIGSTYYEALVGDSGSLAPFADDCVRRENGIQTTRNPPPPAGATSLSLIGTMGCAEQLDTHFMDYLDAIDNRRVEIADVETGLVLGLSHFRHSMVNKKINIVGVPGVEELELNYNAFDLPAAHIYKITGGQIHEIEAMGFSIPYNSKTGWE